MIELSSQKYLIKAPPCRSQH